MADVRRLAELSIFLRYAVTLPIYLLRRMGSEEAERRLRKALADRESSFLRILERGVFGYSKSPYLQLLRWAGIELGDVRELVHREGLEGALRTLYEAGVYVTLDEVKGRRGIERPGLHIPASLTAFDNPLSKKHYEARTSGSRGPRTRTNIDLGMLEHEAAYIHQYLDAFDLWRRPYGIWRPVPPVAPAIKWLLRFGKLGKPVDRWFSQTRHELRRGQWKFALFTFTTVAAGKLLGRRFPAPEHVPGDAPEPIARWLAEVKRSGRPAVLDTMVSSAVRVCGAARERGLDVSGTLFRLGGEPLTDATANIIAAAGCHALCFYNIGEMNLIGTPCANPDALDDVHLLTDKLGVLLRPKVVGDTPVEALIYTTLLPSSPKLMLNVESGDYALLTTRDCGCPMGRLGFRHHLRDIRSYEKLTSEGVTFLGTELLRLLEEVLPQSFGGAPADYQLVQAEEAGVSRIFIVASPRLGPLEEGVVVERVLETLSGYPGGSVMTQHWRDGQTLRLLRREPYRTASGKILPLHFESSSTQASRSRGVDT